MGVFVAIGRKTTCYMSKIIFDLVIVSFLLLLHSTSSLLLCHQDVKNLRKHANLVASLRKSIQCVVNKRMFKVN
jgi:hypothetical protein